MSRPTGRPQSHRGRKQVKINTVTAAKNSSMMIIGEYLICLENKHMDRRAKKATTTTAMRRNHHQGGEAAPKEKTNNGSPPVIIFTKLECKKTKRN